MTATVDNTRNLRRVTWMVIISSIAFIIAAVCAILSAIVADYAPELAETATSVETTQSDLYQVKYTNWVSGTGEQEIVDACNGGLTLMKSVTDWIGKPYYPIHKHCGGEPILDLENGDLVRIDDKTYTVVGDIDVTRSDNADALIAFDLQLGSEGVKVDAFIQTCYDNTATVMRVVALTEI